ncbi:MAG: LLM class F420-dependent oxidoreductase [Actinomycetota bacterium]|nr:LLM class F420-dependent oxidoreductase [Actinomycetota bacterium]
MDLSLSLPQLGRLGTPNDVALVAARAEALGFTTGWVLDRLLAPVTPRSPYPATADGSLPEVYSSCLDPLGTLAFAAAHTTTLGLGTSVLNLPWYRPLELARQLSTLDVLSGGRLRIGFGVGWSQDEAAGLGVPFRVRGRLADEALDALLAVWAADPVEFHGTGFDIASARHGPKPAQSPHPPLYFAGYTERSLQRIARYGDGWLPAGLPLPVLQGMWRRLRELTEAAGRDPAGQCLIVRANATVTAHADGQPFVGTVRQIADEIVACAEAGAHEVHLDLQFTPAIRTGRQYLDTAGEVLDLVRARLDRSGPVPAA